MTSKNEAYMARTLHPKMNHYPSEQFGNKDHFITISTGGLTTTKVENYSQSHYSYGKAGNPNSSPSFSKEGIHLDFRSDGSRRGSYNKANSGAQHGNQRGSSGRGILKESLS